MTIASEIERLQNAKQSIKTSIVNKGVAVGDTVKLDGYSSLIDAISTGGKRVTQAEYDALPSSKLTDGVPYIIVDSSGNVLRVMINGKAYFLENPSFSYLLVGGGGGGAAATPSASAYISVGGGGGGQVKSGTVNVSTVFSYAVKVGAGGYGGSRRASSCGGVSVGCDGCRSCLGSYYAEGGKGGTYLNGSYGRIGGASGSGCVGGFVTSFCGGGGGGGGANGNGCDGDGNAGGNGGVGLSGYGGGGGGGGTRFSDTGSKPGCGGSGGGGNGGGYHGENKRRCYSSSGTNQTGGGGGGASYGMRNGTDGGSGLVKICYKTGVMSATGGTITTSGCYTIHTFTSDGTFNICQ